MLEKRQIIQLNKIREDVHDKLEKSINRHLQCKSMIDLEEEKTLKRREENKIKQFEDFFFFFDSLKRKKKNASLMRIQKMENNQTRKTQKLKEMEGKNKETLQNIERIMKNKEWTQEKLNNSLLENREILEKQMQQVLNAKEKLDSKRNQGNKEVLVKQVEFITQSEKIGQAAKLNSQHLK